MFFNFTKIDVIWNDTNDDYSADLDNYNITLDVAFEKPITLDGNYDIKGKVIILPITGDGLSKIVLGTLFRGVHKTYTDFVIF